MLKIQKSGEKKLYTGSIDCVKKIYGSYGLAGVYKATVATIYREFIAFGMFKLGNNIRRSYKGFIFWDMNGI